MDTPRKASRLVIRLVIGTLIATATSLFPTAGLPDAEAEPDSGYFYVNSTDDNNHGDSFLTLREALLVARGGTGATGLGGSATPQEQALLTGCTFSGGLITGGCGAGIADTIVFSAGLGIHPVITLTTPLPDIDDSLGTYLYGQINGVAPIILGTLLPASRDILTVTSSNNSINAVTFNGAPRDDLRITGAQNYVSQVTLINAGRYGLNLDGGDLNTIDASQVGVNGPFAGICTQSNSQGGIIVANGAISNTISHDTIACNGGVGVRVTGPTSHGNSVWDSTVAGQAGNGVEIVSGAYSNHVGFAGDGNAIFSNAVNGVAMYDAGTSNNLVYSNRIGLDGAGAVAANGGYGVDLAFNADHNHIGEGFGIAERNYISGNALGGVHLRTGAHTNLVESNYIGLNVAGTGAAPNGGPGVDVDGAPNNTIGSSTVGAAQFISGNHGPGVRVANTSGVFVGQTNSIGVAGNGTSPMGNQGAGVILSDTFNSSVLALSISFNQGAGVAVVGAGSQDDKIQPYSVFSNGRLPIDLGDDGHTANDAGDGDAGPNTLLNYPVITDWSGNVITGTACANCGIVIYRAVADPAAPGGGATYQQTANADAGGHWHTTLPAGQTRFSVTAQACANNCVSFNDNTSELSPRPALFLPLVQR